jgi:hypothetical protein
MPGEQTPPPPVPEPPADDTTPGAEEAAGDVGTKASDCGHAHLQLAERRAPRGPECYLALDEMAARFDDAKTAIREATAATRARLIAEVSGRAKSAADRGTLNRFMATAPPMVDALTADIRAVLDEFYAVGRKQVADEMRRQRDGEPVAEEIVEERSAASEPETRSLADDQKKKAKREAVDEDELERQAEITARTIAADTQAAAAAIAVRSALTPMDAAAIAALVTRESDASALRMSAIVTDLMSAGRADEARVNAQDIAYAQYSAILDGVVCAECEPLDGETTEDLTEAESWTPNPNCEGGGNCRCVTVYVYKQGEAA